MKESESRGRNNSFLILQLETTLRAGSSKSIQNGLLSPAHQKREEDTTDEYPKDETAVWY
jgi:hypothetical protein